MQQVSRAFFPALLLGASPLLLLAQFTPESHFIAEVQSAAISLSSQPELFAWKASHSHDRIDLAHYQTASDFYETDFFRANQWCATSLAVVPAKFTLAASFYVPAVSQGALPPLPPKQDPGLIGSCRLGAMWFEIPGPNAVPSLVKELAVAWGPPSGSCHNELARTLFIRGSKYWKDISLWRRGNISVWLAWTDWDKGNSVGSRTIIFMLRDRPPDLDLFKVGFDVTAAALKIADLRPALTRDISPETSCANLPSGNATERLSRWLRAAHRLPSDRRAAALLVADRFVPCVMASGAKPPSLTSLGVKFRRGCTPDGRQGKPMWASFIVLAPLKPNRSAAQQFQSLPNS